MDPAFRYSQIIKIAYPIFITLLVQNLIQVINTAFLGHVGEVELGASAIAGIIYIVIFTLAFGFSVGSQILIGRRNGEQNYHQIGEIVVYGALFLLAIAMSLFLFVRTSSRWFLHPILSSPDILEASITYLDWRIFGIFFASINVMFRAFYVGITFTRILTVNALLMASVNIVLDYLLIFGNGGFPEMGLAGAALASVIAEATSVLFFVLYTFFAIDLHKYGFATIRSGIRKVIRNILNVSMSLMLQYLIQLGTWLIFFLTIEKMGEQSLAASNIVRSIFILFAVPIFALSTTTNTLVSNAIGAGRTDDVMPLIWRVVKISLALASLFMLPLSLFPDTAIGIYTSNPELISAARSSLFVIVAALPVMAFGNILFSSVSGTGNTDVALWLEIGVMFIYLSYLWLLVNVLNAPLAICWTAEIVYPGVIFLFSYIYMRSNRWKNRKI